MSEENRTKNVDAEGDEGTLMVEISLMRTKGIITPRPSPKLLRPLPQASRAKAWLSKHALSQSFRRIFFYLKQMITKPMMLRMVESMRTWRNFTWEMTEIVQKLWCLRIKTFKITVGTFLFQSKPSFCQATLPWGKQPQSQAC